MSKVKPNDQPNFIDNPIFENIVINTKKSTEIFICDTYDENNNEHKILKEEYVKKINSIENFIIFLQTSKIVKKVNSNNKKLYIFDPSFIMDITNLTGPSHFNQQQKQLQSTKTNLPTVKLQLAPSSFLYTFLTENLPKICNNMINFEYIFYAFQSNYNIFVLNQDNHIDGFAFIRPVKKTDFTLKTVEILIPTKLIDYSIKLLDNIDIIYVDVICSEVKTGAGAIIFDYLETLKDKYQAVVLRGIYSAYSYYLKRGYMRTIDLINEYPVYITKKNQYYYLEDVQSILNCFQKLPDLLEDITEKISHFTDDGADLGFIFMKKIIPTQGGKSKILYNSHYYKIRTNNKNKQYIKTKTGDILLSKIKHIKYK